VEGIGNMRNTLTTELTTFEDLDDAASLTFRKELAKSKSQPLTGNVWLVQGEHSHDFVDLAQQCGKAAIRCHTQLHQVSNDLDVITFKTAEPKEAALTISTTWRLDRSGEAENYIVQGINRLIREALGSELVLPTTQYDQTTPLLMSYQ
jgi:hypothetical protein